MPKTKNSIKIRHGERELYRIFKDLEKYNRATFCYPDRPKIQSNIARSIGMRTVSLVEKDLFVPLTVSRWHKPPINAVQLPKNVEVIERKKGNISRFYFRKIDNIF